MIMRRCVKCNLFFDEADDLNEENICEKCERKTEMGKKKKKNKNQKAVTKKGDNSNNNDSEAWEVEIDCVTECSKSPSEITVWMMPLVKEQIEALMVEYKNIEWLAYLIGDWVDDSTPVVKELFIPEQKVSSASVNNINCPEHNDINGIGVIHSHHNMSHKFSQIDDDWINQNHNISLVVSHTGMEGQVRWKTPCGSLMTIKAKTKLWYDVEFDKEDFLKKAKEKINENTYNASNISPGGWNNRWNNNFNAQQESYMNGNSVKQGVQKEEKETKDEDTINNNEDTTEDIPWEVEMKDDFDEAETLKDALTAYEEEITDISKAEIPEVIKQTSVPHAK